MKRTICFLLSMMTIITLAACGSSGKAVDVQAQADALVTNCTFDSPLSPVSAEELGFYFDVPEGTEIAGYLSDGNTAEIVVCANCKSADDAKALMTSYESYAADRKQEAERYQPQEVARIDNGLTTRAAGTNAVLVICADTDSVGKVLGGY